MIAKISRSLKLAYNLPVKHFATNANPPPINEIQEMLKAELKTPAQI
jgi:hypothetical protein